LTAEDWWAVIRGQRRGWDASVIRGVLWGASWPYRAAIWLRNRRYDWGLGVTFLPVPIVSVGNLSLGGTGKTPCVEWVARVYREKELQVAILSRGYGASSGRNDEAMVLDENLPDVPHLQGPDRVTLAKTAIEELESDVLVLDDGFQHRRLGRHLDLVLIDATQPPHHDYVFPRGTLREPIHELHRADAIILTRCDQADPEDVDRLRRRFSCPIVATTSHAPIELVGLTGHRPLSELRGKPIAAFCGLGNPIAFRRTLEDLGADLIAFRTYPDHHPYHRADVEELCSWAESLPSDTIITTTQKDFVKLRILELAGRPVWAVRVGLRFQDGEDAIRERLDAVLATDRRSPDPEER
jgi:tetraacyldisaccharide 4'-kinase